MREKENKEEKKVKKIKNRIKINKKIKHEKIIFFYQFTWVTFGSQKVWRKEKKMLRKIVFS